MRITYRNFMGLLLMLAILGVFVGAIDAQPY